MFPALGLTLALMAPGAPIPRDVAPAGPAPYILQINAEKDGKVRFTVMRSEKVKVTRVQFQGGPNGQQVPVQTESEVAIQKYVRVELTELKDVKVYSVDGKEVAIKDAAKKLGETAMAIASTNGQKVDPTFLKLFKDDVLIVVSPDLAPNGPGYGGYGYPGTMPGGPAIMPFPAPPALPPGVAPGIQILPPVAVDTPIEAPPVIKKPDVKKD